MLRQSLLQNINRPARNLAKRQLTRRLSAYLRRNSARKFLRQAGMIAGNDSKYWTRRRQAISSALPDWSPTAFPEAMESLGSIGLNQSFASDEAAPMVEQLSEAVTDPHTQEPERIFGKASDIAKSIKQSPGKQSPGKQSPGKQSPGKQSSGARISVASTTREIRASLLRRSCIEEMGKSAGDFSSAKKAVESVADEVSSISTPEPSNFLKAIDPFLGVEKPRPAELFADTGKDRSPAAWAAKLARSASSGSAPTLQERQIELRAQRRPTFKGLARTIEKMPNSTEPSSDTARRFSAPLAAVPETIEAGSKFFSVAGNTELRTIGHDGAERDYDVVSPNAEQGVTAPPAKKFIPAAVRSAIENAGIRSSRFFPAVASTLPMVGKPLTTAADLLSKPELPELGDFQPTVDPQSESLSPVGLAGVVPQLQSVNWPEVSADLRSSSVAPVETTLEQTGEEIDWGGLPAPWEALPDWAASTISNEEQKGETSSSDVVLKNVVADNRPKTDMAELGGEMETSFAKVVRENPAMMSLTEAAASQTAMDLDELAKQVYQRLKRRLSMERRRETN
jgi:hypothetical protein